MLYWKQRSCHKAYITSFTVIISLTPALLTSNAKISGYLTFTHNSWEYRLAPHKRIAQQKGASSKGGLAG